MNDPRTIRERDDREAPLELDAAWTTRLLVEFLVRELGRTGRERFVLGLSGGIDSALSAALAVRALGPSGVIGIRMPYRTSSPDSLEDAERLAQDLGIRTETVDISPMVDAFRAAADDVDPHRLGNVMARMRMVVLFDRSERHEALVLGSSNKTELLLGYGTLYGDLASAINPLGDLYKTQVRALAAHLGVPRSILRKPPSADLIPGQTDEADLGYPYETLDRVLALLVDARLGVESVVARGHAPELVQDLVRRVVRSQFKRRPTLIAKVSTRSIDWDFRYPRDWLS